MNITAKFPLPHAGQIIPAGATADLPDNLARMLIARGQAKPGAQASAQAPAIASAAAGHPAPPPGTPALAALARERSGSAGSSAAPKLPPKSSAVP